MQVHFSSEEEARIAQYANRSGKDTEQVVREAVDLLLGDAGFAEAVEKGLASLDRGEYVDHAEVGTRLERLLER